MFETNTQGIHTDRNPYRTQELVKYPLATPEAIQRRVSELVDSTDKNRIIKELIVNHTIDANEIIATLFAFKRSEYHRFKPEKELLAITAVINLLKGNFVTLDTAAGKSQVVLPIAALTLSFLTHEAVILPTGQESLVPALLRHIENLIRQVGTVVEPQDQKLWQEISYCGKLVENVSDPKTAADFLEASLCEPLVDELEKRATTGGFFVTTYNDLAFYAFNHPEMWGKFPPCLGDEISAPFDANESMLQSPAHLERKPIPFDETNNDLMEYTINYTVERVIHQVLHANPDNFEMVKGSLRLSPQGLLTITHIARSLEDYLGILSDIEPAPAADYRTVLKRIEHRVDTSKIPEDMQGFHAAIKQALDEAVAYFHPGTPVPPKERNRIKRAISEKMFIFFDQTLWDEQLKFASEDQLSDEHYSVEPTEEYLISQAKEMVHAMNIRKGLDYLDNPSELKSIYSGERKLRHSFLTDTALALQAINGDFNPKATDQALTYYMHFPTVLTLLLGGRLAATDASLCYTNPRSGERTPTAFVRVINDLLGRDVVDLSSDVLPVPVPITEIGDTSKLIARMVAEIQGRGNIAELVVCRNEETVDELVLAMHQAGIKYDLIHAKTTEDDKDAIFDRLASGELHVCVTTGPGSLGKNIEDRIAGYPNLHVTEFGMPSSLEQFTQTLRRRRREDKNESDFSWYIPLEEARQWLTLLKEKPRREWLIAGALPTDFARGLDLVTRATQGTLQIGEDLELKDLMLYLLEERARERQTNAEDLVNYETLWSTQIAPHVRAVKEAIFSEFFESSWLEQLLDTRLNELLSAYDCSSALRTYIKKSLFTPRLQQWFTSFEGHMHTQFLSDCINHPQSALMHYDPKQQDWRNNLIKGLWYKRLMKPKADQPKDKRSDKQKDRDAKEQQLQQEVDKALDRKTETQSSSALPLQDLLLKDFDDLVEGKPINYFTIWQEKLTTQQPEWQARSEAEEQITLALTSVEGALKTMQKAATLASVPFNTIIEYNNVPTPILQPDLNFYGTNSPSTIAELQQNYQSVVNLFVLHSSPLAHGQKALSIDQQQLVTAPSDYPTLFAGLPPILLTVGGEEEKYYLADSKGWVDEQNALNKEAIAKLPPEKRPAPPSEESQLETYRYGYEGTKNPTTKMLWFYVPKPAEEPEPAGLHPYDEAAAANLLNSRLGN